MPNRAKSLFRSLYWSWQVLVLLVAVNVSAQTLAFDHAQTVAIAGLNEGYAFGRAIAADAQGNTYVTGSYRGTQHFGSITLIANPATPTVGTRMYVAKIAPDGQVLWAVQGGGNTNNYSYSITLDGEGNVYVAGDYLGRTATYGSTTLQNTGNGSFFIAKLNATTGQWQWAIGNPDGGNARINSLAIGPAGTISVAGTLGERGHQGPIAIRLGPFVLANAGSDDILVGKLDRAGNWRWAVAVGGIGTEEAARIALDKAGNAYIAGRFSGPRLAFGPYPLVHSQAGINSSEDAFVAKIDSVGIWQWATGAGGVGIDQGYGIAVDDHRVFITGRFSRDADFGGTRLTSSGETDVFVACLTQSGSWQWAVRGGGLDDDYGRAVAADGMGGAYVGGSFHLNENDVAQFGSTMLRSAGTTDAFVARLDSSGNYTGAIAGGGVYEDDCAGIAVVGNKVYLTGSISSSLDASPTAQFGGYKLAANPTTYGRMHTAWVSKIIALPSGHQPPSDEDDLNNWNAQANLPNIITPNNDGNNDYFAPQNFPAGPWQLTIYSRWGNQVYNAADYKSDWGAKTTAGIYYYLLRHQASSRTFKGWLEVVR